MSGTECKIQMLDLYFSKYDFKLERGNDTSDYNTSFRIEYAISNSDNSKIKITINTEVKNNTESIYLNLETIGVFQVDQIEMDKEMYDALVQMNTVAIMFPYIRAQISLLTTQPGMMPIMIPPVNINALIDSQK